MRAVSTLRFGDLTLLYSEPLLYKEHSSLGALGVLLQRFCKTPDVQCEQQNQSSSSSQSQVCLSQLWFCCWGVCVKITDLFVLVAKA